MRKMRQGHTYVNKNGTTVVVAPHEATYHEGTGSVDADRRHDLKGKANAIHGAGQYEQTVDVLQANNLTAVASAVRAVQDGCLTNKHIAEAIGMHERQGHYYAQAAAKLGLIHDISGDRTNMWDTTAEGRLFLDAEGDDQADFLAGCLSDLEEIDTFLQDGGRERLVEDWQARGLDAETIQRRMSTVESWSEFYTATTGEQTKRLSTALKETTVRAGEIVARRKAQEHRRQGVLCPGCFVRQPAALPDECESCGTPIPQAA